MKRLLALTTVFLLLASPTLAEEYIFDDSLYGASSVTVDVDVQNTIYHEGDVSRIEATLLYYPRAFDEQEILSEQTTPIAQEEDDALVYTWQDPPNPATLRYEARVKSNYDRPHIREQIAFPYEYVPPEYAQYLGSEEIIRITPDIRAQAEGIVGDEDDAARAVFALGRWVKDNIEYDLNTVTAEASQTSEWVLEERRGVCDELTSLFIAMARSQGIPARFISGVAYTNLEGLDSPWGPHGWAEVYFPGHGWVPYDVTYGQYGYVDATHIAFTAEADAKSNAAEYVMHSRDGYMEPDPLERTVSLVARGEALGADLDVDVEAALDEVGFGSANRVDVTVRNRRPYYVATELFLARTNRLSTEDYSKSLLLGPGEKRTVHWTVTLDGNLQSGYEYTFPVAIYTNQNQSYSDAFTARSGGVVASSEDLAVSDGEQSETLPEPLSCTAPETVRTGEEFTVSCTYPDAATLCLEECVSGTQVSEAYTFDDVGAHTIAATAERSGATAREIITVVVEDEPRLSLSAQTPRTVMAGERAVLTIRLNKTSVAAPKNVEVRLEHPLFSQRWSFDSLDKNTRLSVQYYGNQLAAGENEIRVEARWDGDEERASVTVTPVAERFSQRVVLWTNRLVAWVSGLA